MKEKKFIKLGLVSLLAVFISLTSIYAVKATTNSLNESKNKNTLYEQTEEGTKEANKADLEIGDKVIYNELSGYYLDCETPGGITFSREEVENSDVTYIFSYLPESLFEE
ncbi:hypothetical protein [Lachnospira multipara]|uniref:hypothetical protein n=1 Tax=Lachnospira multipara TaxID=28051 RepID=UPI0004E0F660|nr:hypothetical protein [Lachnospira multipara]